VASDRQAALLAQQENKSDIIAGVDLGGQDADVNRILIDLAQRESMDASAEFARLLHREASTFFPFRPNYHRFASLLVLKAPDIPRSCSNPAISPMRPTPPTSSPPKAGSRSRRG
jgi:N-acetylmuramoyl-L-alanine amidase